MPSNMRNFLVCPTACRHLYLAVPVIKSMKSDFKMKPENTHTIKQIKQERKMSQEKFMMCATISEIC